MLLVMLLQAPATKSALGAECRYTCICGDVIRCKWDSGFLAPLSSLMHLPPP